MRLKIWTTLCLVTSLALLACSSLILGPRPAASDQMALARYGANGLILFGVICVGLLLSAFLATRIMRQVREEFTKEALKNFQETLKQETKANGHPESGPEVDGASDRPLS